MRNLIEIDGTSFYTSHYQRLSWSIRSLDDTRKTAEKQQDSKSNATDAREAMRDHLAQITGGLQQQRGLVDYEVALEFPDPITGAQKEEFTTLFNEFNTRDESN